MKVILFFFAIICAVNALHPNIRCTSKAGVAMPNTVCKSSCANWQVEYGTGNQPYGEVDGAKCTGSNNKCCLNKFFFWGDAGSGGTRVAVYAFNRDHPEGGKKRLKVTERDDSGMIKMADALGAEGKATGLARKIIELFKDKRVKDKESPENDVTLTEEAIAELDFTTAMTAGGRVAEHYFGPQDTAIFDKAWRKLTQGNGGDDQSLRSTLKLISGRAEAEFGWIGLFKWMKDEGKTVVNKPLFWEIGGASQQLAFYAPKLKEDGTSFIEEKGPAKMDTAKTFIDTVLGFHHTKEWGWVQSWVGNAQDEMYRAAIRACAQEGRYDECPCLPEGTVYEADGPEGRGRIPIPDGLSGQDKKKAEEKQPDCDIPYLYLGFQQRNIKPIKGKPDISKCMELVRKVYRGPDGSINRKAPFGKELNGGKNDDGSNSYLHGREYSVSYGKAKKALQSAASNLGDTTYLSALALWGADKATTSKAGYFKAQKSNEDDPDKPLDPKPWNEFRDAVKALAKVDKPVVGCNKYDVPRVLKAAMIFATVDELGFATCSGDCDDTLGATGPFRNVMVTANEVDVHGEVPFVNTLNKVMKERYLDQYVGSPDGTEFKEDKEWSGFVEETETKRSAKRKRGRSRKSKSKPGDRFARKRAIRHCFVSKKCKAFKNFSCGGKSKATKKKRRSGKSKATKKKRRSGKSKATKKKRSGKKKRRKMMMLEIEARPKKKRGSQKKKRGSQKKKRGSQKKKRGSQKKKRGNQKKKRGSQKKKRGRGGSCRAAINAAIKANPKAFAAEVARQKKLLQVAEKEQISIFKGRKKSGNSKKKQSRNSKRGKKRKNKTGKRGRKRKSKTNKKKRTQKKRRRNNKQGKKRKNNKQGKKRKNKTSKKKRTQKKRRRK